MSILAFFITFALLLHFDRILVIFHFCSFVLYLPGVSTPGFYYAYL